MYRPIQNYGSGKVFNVDRSEVVERLDYYRDYTFDAFVKYENSFNDTHNVKALLGTSVFRTKGVFTGLRGFDVDTTAPNIDNADEVEDITKLEVSTQGSILVYYHTLLDYNTIIKANIYFQL